MVEIFVECYLKGKHFDPFKVEKKIGVNFLDKVKKGDLRTKGPSKDKPYPFGFCYLKPEIDSDDENQKLENILEVIEKANISIGKYDIEEMHVRLDVNYDAQCNLELEPSILKKLSNRKIPLLISCYKIK